MKLSSSIDLEPIREKALYDVDRIFAGKVAETTAMHQLYELKYTMASEALSGSTPHDSLVEEAGLRGLKVADHCRAIVDAAQGHSDGLLSVELERQRAKAALRAATHQHAIEDIVAGAGR